MLPIFNSSVISINLLNFKRIISFLGFFFVLNGTVVSGQCLPDSLKNLANNKAKIQALYEFILSKDFGDSVASACRIKELQELSEQLKFEQGRAYSYYLLGRLAFNYAAYEMALNNYAKANEISGKINYSDDQMKIYYWTSRVYRRIADYQNYEHYLNLLLQKSLELKDKQYASFAYEGYGNLYRYLGDYAQSIENYVKAIELSEELGNYADVSMALNNMSLVYDYQSKYAEELNVLLKVYDVIQKHGRKNQIVLCLSNLAGTYGDMGKKEKMDSCLNEVARLINEIGVQNLHFKDVCGAYDQFANQQMNEGNYKKAAEIINKSLLLCEKHKEKKGICEEYGKLARLYILSGDLEKAHTFLNKYLTIANEIGYADARMTGYREMAELEIKRGNYNAGYEYLNKYVSIKDSVTTNYNTKRLAEAEVRFKVKDQQQQIKLLSKDKQMQALELERKSILSSGLMVVVFLVLVIAGVFLFAYFQKQKLNSKLVSMVDERTQALTQRNKDLKDFIYRSSHDLRSPITTIRGLVSLMQSNVSNAGLISECLPKINSTIEKQDQMLISLLRISGLMESKLVIAPVRLHTLFNEVIEDVKQEEQARGVELVEAVEDGLEITTDKAILKSVIENLVSNAIKFKRRQSSLSYVKLEASKNESGILIKVSDNGIGISEEWKQRVFDLFIRASGDTVGFGLGLYIVKNSVQKLGGKINVTSELKKGSVFSVWLPNAGMN